MLRGYRGTIVALAGLVLLGAGPPKADGNQPPDAPLQQVNPALNKIATALGEANKPSTLEQPCLEGEDQRSSDLCAQWKAADAAKSASVATWIFGAIGTLIGSLTLAAAWSAAKWARQAAEQTKRAADVAEAATAGAGAALSIASQSALAAETSAAAALLAQRPWLVINLSNPEPIQDGGDMLQTIITVEAVNIGNSPAVRYVLASALMVVPRFSNHDAALPIAWERIETHDAERLKHGDTLFPRLPNIWRHGFQARLGDTPRDAPIFLAGAGVVRFEFGNQIAHAAFRFVLTDGDHKPFTVNAPPKDLQIQLFKLKAEGEPQPMMLSQIRVADQCPLLKTA
jgi:hypothetical protein